MNYEANKMITLLTEQQLAKQLQIPVRTIQNQRQTGMGIPFIKIGKSVRYDTNEIEAFIERNRRNSTSQDFAQM